MARPHLQSTLLALSFIDDITTALRLWRYWTYSSFLRLQADYTKTLLRYLWEPATVFFVATILTLVWSRVLDIADPKSYFLYLLSGIAVWNLISDLVRNGVSSLLRNKRNISERTLPMSIYILEDISFSIFKFLATIPFVILAIIILKGWGGSVTLMAFSIFSIIIAGFSFSITFGLLAYFFQDIRYVVNATMRLAFLVTPIIWTVDRLGNNIHKIYFNPFYPFIDIFRTSLGIGDINGYSIYYVAILDICLLSIGIVFMSILSKDIRTKAAIQ